MKNAYGLALKIFSLPVLALVAAGCATTTPQELLDARTAYDRTSHGPAATLAPSDVHTAQEALANAEQTFQDKGDSDSTRDAAYAATRASQIADEKARIEADQKQIAMATADRDRLRDMQGKELVQTREQLADQTTRAADAERRARMAMADLARVSAVKQDTRGTIITLSGGVLFASGKSDLLPSAQAQLSTVADALTKQSPDAPIQVNGYTDSQGADSFNMNLSQARADAVRSFFVSHGVAADRITAQGFGPANPVADNKSAEGRADNRRVEIVIGNHNTAH